MPSTSFEEAKAFLQKTTPTSSVSVYDHLSDLVLRVLRDSPSDALANIETISTLVKAERLRPARLEEGFAANPGADWKSAMVRSSVEVASLFPAPSPDTDAPDPPTVRSNDILGESSLLQWAGVGFGDEATLKLALAVQNLEPLVPNAISIRFFGRFLCVSGDYSVCEVALSEHDAPADDIAETRAEPPGQGANTHVYYVMSSNRFGSWTKLPHVLPEQIRICCSKKRLLSGDLSASVGGTPFFRWNEAAFVRALIARIGASTIIAPKGFYETKEDEGGIGPAETFDAPAPSAMTTVDGWVHRHAAVLKQGRMAPFVKEESEEAAEKEAVEGEADEEPEEAVPALRSLADDVSDLGPSLWSFRVVGGPHSIVTAASLTWPGAVAVIKGKVFVNVYIGDGQRQTARPRQPILPGAFQGEFKDEPDEPKLTFQEDPLPPPATEPESPVEPQS